MAYTFTHTGAQIDAIHDKADFLTVTGAKDIDKTVEFDIDSATPLNSVTRLRMSDKNYISNSAFQSWLAGTSVAPDGWTLAGTATIAQDSGTAYVGDYSVALTLGAATDGEFYAIFGANSLVDYTFSAYVSRTSGTGNMRMVAQQNFGSYTEDESVACSTTSGQQLVTLTFQPSADGNYRVAFKATDSAGSTWRIDEVKVQESLGIATTYTPTPVDDSFDQDIYGVKDFKTEVRENGYQVAAVETGTAAPATTPSKLGQLFVDYSNGNVYISKGTASSADWVQVN